VGFQKGKGVGGSRLALFSLIFGKSKGIIGEEGMLKTKEARSAWGFFETGQCWLCVSFCFSWFVVAYFLAALLCAHLFFFFFFVFLFACVSST
jgi:hypothetical protein